MNEEKIILLLEIFTHIISNQQKNNVNKIILKNKEKISQLKKRKKISLKNQKKSITN